MTEPLTAKVFIKRLTALKKEDGWSGVRMGDIFKLGKEFQMMPVAEIETLMESDTHKIRSVR